MDKRYKKEFYKATRRDGSSNALAVQITHAKGYGYYATVRPVEIDGIQYGFAMHELVKEFLEQAPRFSAKRLQEFSFDDPRILNLMSLACEKFSMEVLEKL